MAISEPYEIDGVTVGTTELSVVSGTTTLQTVTDDGYYQFFVDDGGNMAKADYFLMKVKEKVEGTGGTQKLLFPQRISQAQAEIWAAPPVLLINGWDFTLTKVSGTDRAFDASIRKVS